MKSRNPFSLLLLVTAVLFCIAASSYCVMTLTRSAEATFGHAAREGGLVQFLDRHGATLLAGLVAALALLTVAAIATDGYWTRRPTDRNDDSDAA
jgi:hypothetical protein